MVETSTLLSLLEFVALLAPAFVILRQVQATQRDLGETGVPPEFWVVRYGLILVLGGGLFIGWRLLQQITDLMILGGILMIFGSLPFLAAAVWLSDYQISLGFTDTRDIRQLANSLLSIGQESLFVRLPMVLLVTAVVYGGTWFLVRGLVERHVAWGLFLTNEALTPALVLAVELSLIGIGGVFWTFEEVEMLEITTLYDVVTEALLTQILLLVSFLLAVVPVYGIWFGGLLLGAEPTSSIVWSVPVVWSFLVTFAIMVVAGQSVEEEFVDGVVTVLVTYTVNDHERWRSLYEEFANRREEYGELDALVYHRSSDPNEIVTLAEWTSFEDVKAFLETTDFREEIASIGTLEVVELSGLPEVEES